MKNSVKAKVLDGRDMSGKAKAINNGREDDVRFYVNGNKVSVSDFYWEMSEREQIEKIEWFLSGVSFEWINKGEFEKSKIDLLTVQNVKISGIDHDDAPRYCDAFIESCTINGEEATEEQLDELNNDWDFVYLKIQEFLY